MGVTNEGKIRAADADIRFEAGAFPGSAVTAGAICILACYNIPDVRIDGRDVVINKPKSAAYRAPGSPQVAFAAEQVVDEICDKMGWDKIQFRLDNASQEGTRRADGPAFARVGLVETLEAARSSDHWNSPLEGSGADGNLLGPGHRVGVLDEWGRQVHVRPGRYRRWHCVHERRFGRHRWHEGIDSHASG